MQRFLKNYVAEESDSLVSNDYNWNDLSIGNDTLGGDRFFGIKHPEHEKRGNAIGIVFEDTLPIGDLVTNDENEPNGDIMHVGNSAESDQLSSGLDDVHLDTAHEQKSKSNVRNVMRPPLTPHNAKDQNVPNVIRSIQLYEAKKKMRMQKLQLKEQEQRKFHAKPAPNFSAIHEARTHKKSLEELKITVPVTPKVVHNHRKNMERLKAKQKEIEEAAKPKPFVSKDAEVLSKKPFVPQHTKKSPIEAVPFNLQSDERLRVRKQFDQDNKMRLERKEKEEEEQRKIEDERIRREIRKATQFKAHPNPFHSN